MSAFIFLTKFKKLLSQKLCDLWDTMPRHWLLFFLLSPCYLQNTMSYQWSCSDSFTASAADLRERVLLSGIVYLILLPAIFQRLPAAGSLTLILAGLHVDIFET